LAFFSTDSAFSQLYRGLWADNGDALSKQYTGTGSTESFAVRKGKLSYLTTLDHGMKSIFRVIRNIRNEDEKKQEAICFILGEKMTDYTK
jgi:synaptojanin